MVTVQRIMDSGSTLLCVKPQSQLHNANIHVTATTMQQQATFTVNNNPPVGSKVTSLPQRTLNATGGGDNIPSTT